MSALDLDADAIAVSETGVFEPCQAKHWTEPDALCDELASRWATTWLGTEVLVCAEHGEAIDAHTAACPY